MAFAFDRFGAVNGSYGLSPHVVILLVAFALGLLGLRCDAPDASSDAARQVRLQITIDSLRGAAGFPGATAAVIGRDGRVHAVATGYADQEDSTVMTPDSRMLGGSTGKSFVAAVVLSLVDDGLVDLDDPVRTWLGDYAWFDRLPNARTLTLRHLLRHRSGLVDHIHTEAFQRAIQEKMRTEGADARLTPDEIVRLVADTRPLFSAGERYHYSDTNYILVGLVIEDVTGRSYYDVLERRLLDPLRLDATDPADRRSLPDLAAGYIQGEAPFGLPSKVTQDGGLVYNPATEWTGGGLVTTSTDLARWAKALYEGAALSGDYRQSLFDAVPKDSSQRARFGPDVRYGLGVTIRSTTLGPAYGHRGWTPGYLSIFEYYPEHEVGVAMQVNAINGYDLSSYAVRIGRTAIGVGAP